MQRLCVSDVVRCCRTSRCAIIGYRGSWYHGDRCVVSGDRCVASGVDASLRRCVVASLWRCGHVSTVLCFVLVLKSVGSKRASEANQLTNQPNTQQCRTQRIAVSYLANLINPKSSIGTLQTYKGRSVTYKGNMREEQFAFAVRKWSSTTDAPHKCHICLQLRAMSSWKGHFDKSHGFYLSKLRRNVTSKWFLIVI